MHQRKALILLTVLLMLPAVPIQGQTVNKTVTFQPNSIPDVDVYYEDYSFVFELKGYFIRIRPFVIYDGQYYGMQQIVAWIKNNYPNIDYKWLISKSEKAIHYGFNLTRLPQNVADKIDYLGFRLIDLNFPLSWFELEEITIDMDEEGNFVEPYNITRIHIPKANLCFSFEDLYPLGYTVTHINSTYVLVGQVRGKTDLILDPITYSAPTITVTGYTEAVPCTFTDVYDADVAGEWGVVSLQGTSQFLLDAKLQIGDSVTETWFADEQVQIVWNTSLICFDVKNNAHLRFGTVSGNGNPEKGCEIKNLGVPVRVAYARSGSEVKGYDSKFDITRQADFEVGSTVILKQIISSHALLSVKGTTIVDNYLQVGGTEGPGFSGTLTLNDIKIFDISGVLGGITTTGPCTITNLYLRNNDIAVRMATQATGGGSVYLVNPDIDLWSINWAWPGAGDKLYRQYTFNLHVTFPNSTAISQANVTVYTVNGVMGSWLTDWNGDIPEQTLSMGHYQQSTGNTLNSYNPYNLTIIYPDFQTYSKNWTLTEKTNWEIALSQAPEGNGGGGIPITYLYIGVILAAVVSAIVVSSLLESR